VELRDELEPTLRRRVAMNARSQVAGRSLATAGSPCVRVNPQTDEEARRRLKKLFRNVAARLPDRAKDKPSKSGSRRGSNRSARDADPRLGQSEEHGLVTPAISRYERALHLRRRLSANAAPRRLSSSQPPTPRSCPCIWRRSVGVSVPGSHAALVLDWRRLFTSPKISPSRTHHARPAAALRARNFNPIESLEYLRGNNSRSPSRTVRRHSRQVPAMPGHSSQTYNDRNPLPSQPGLGLRSIVGPLVLTSAPQTCHLLHGHFEGNWGVIWHCP